MKRLAFVFFALVPLAVRADDAAKDLKLMQGTWEIAALEVNGQNVPVDRLQGTMLTVKDDSYVVQIKDTRLANTIKLDATKDPRTIDMMPIDGANKDKTLKGIYKVTNDEIKIARGLNPDQERPNQFATWPDTNYFVVTWKRKAD